MKLETNEPDERKRDVFEITGASWFGLVIIIGIATIIVLLFTIALSNITRYKKLRGIIEWFIKTIQYFFFGLGGLGVLAVPTLILFYFGSQASKGNTVPIWITLSIIGGYFIIAGIGYIFKHYIIDRIKKYEEEYQKESPEL